jgi:hypothetical protein
MELDKAIDGTIDAVRRANKTPDNTVCLSSGVMLRAKQANPMLLITVMAAFPRPEPPTQFNSMMGRNMENPDDPDYISRVKAWTMENSNAVLNAFILLGTELVSKPKDVIGPEEDGWLERYEALGLPIKPMNKDWRYLKWVTTIAAVNEKDLELIRDAVGALSGVKEADVTAAATFPGSD